MRYRVYVEIEWFKMLFDQKIVTEDQKQVDFIKSRHDKLDKIFNDFSVSNAERVKEIEKTTNHDVKAIEYFLKEEFDKIGEEDLGKYKEYLHFSCTSEDINNLAYALMLHHSFREVLLPKLHKIQNNLEILATELADESMMCRTHGQSATPSTMGKELGNFAYRLKL